MKKKLKSKRTIQQRLELIEKAPKVLSELLYHDLIGVEEVLDIVSHLKGVKNRLLYGKKRTESIF